MHRNHKKKKRKIVSLTNTKTASLYGLCSHATLSNATPFFLLCSEKHKRKCRTLCLLCLLHLHFQNLHIQILTLDFPSFHILLLLLLPYNSTFVLLVEFHGREVWTRLLRVSKLKSLLHSSSQGERMRIWL